MSAEALAVIFVALFAGSFAKGVTGIGLPLVAVPVMAPFLGVERAVVVMIPPALATNLWLLWEHRRAARALPAVGLMLAFAAAGAVVGTWALAWLDDRVLMIFLAAWLGLYLLSVALRVRLAPGPEAGRVAGPATGALAGVLQGATGMSGPIVAPYFHAMRLEPSVYVLAATCVFTVAQAAQAAAQLGFGLLTWPRLAEGLLALVPALLAMPAALRVQRRLPALWFNRAVLALLAAMEAKLLYGIVTSG